MNTHSSGDCGRYFSPKLTIQLTTATMLCVSGLAQAAAQDIKPGLTYVCNGEREYVESCTIGDMSDSAMCKVAHPDRPPRNGLMAYTYQTRGALKQLFATCKQPSAQD